MTLFLLLLAVAIIGVVAAVAAGRVRGGLDEPTTSLPYRPLPDGALEPADVDAVRFSLALRGYRMEEVDTALRRLATALAERDEELAALRRAQHPQHAQHPQNAQPEQSAPTSAHDAPPQDAAPRTPEDGGDPEPERHQDVPGAARA